MVGGEKQRATLLKRGRDRLIENSINQEQPDSTNEKRAETLNRTLGKFRTGMFERNGNRDRRNGRIAVESQTALRDNKGKREEFPKIPNRGNYWGGARLGKTP